MALSNGPNLGLLVNGALGEVHYTELMRFLRGIDALVMPKAKDKDLATPPGSPADGDTYIVAASPIGAWVGHAGKIARWSTALDPDAWEFITPKEGWEIWLDDEDKRYRHNGSAWVEISTSGGLGRHMVPIMAVAISPRRTNGCAALAYLSGASNQPDVPYLAFDPSVIEYAEFLVSMPPSWNEGAISFVPHWMHPSTTTNFGVNWKLRAVAVSNDDALAATLGTAGTSTDTGGTTYDHYTGPESGAITIAGSPASNDLVLVQLYRDPLDAADTLAVDAWLIGVDIYITTDAVTD